MRKKIVGMIAAAARTVSAVAGCAPTPADETTAAPASAASENTGGESEAADNGATEDLPVLKVAVMPFLNSIPIVYMMNEGLDVQNGFKIEPVYLANGGTMNEALAADQWEVGTLSAAAVNSLAIYGAYCIDDIGNYEG